MRIELPQSWEHVTIKQYKEFVNLKEQGYDPLEHNTHLIKIFTDLEWEDINKLSINHVNEVTSKMTFLRGLNIKQVVKTKISINGHDYKCELNPEKWSAGQYTGLKQSTKDKTIDEALDLILANLYTPVKAGKSQKEIARDFNDYMTIDIAYPAAVFFCKKFKRLTSDIQDSLSDLITKGEKRKQKLMKDLLKDGDGSLLLETSAKK